MTNRDSTANRVEPIRKPDYNGERVKRKSYNRPDIVMKQSEIRAGSAISIFIAAIIAAAMLGSVIYTLNKRNDVYNQIIAQTKVLTELEAENVRLQSKQDSNMTLKNVEEYAENVLGMQKLDKSQIEYICIQTDDVVTIPQAEENIWLKIKNAFNNVVEYLRG